MIAAVPAQASPAPVHIVAAPGGQDLYEFEALIYQRFGPIVTQCLSAQGHPEQSPQPGTCRPGWFYRGYQAGAINYARFMYAFTGFGPSTFHLMPAGFGFAGDSFGNWPTPVTVNGRLVACNPDSTAFLISFGDAMGAGNWDCMQPEPGPLPPPPSMEPAARRHVSAGGQVLYQAEALIWDTFGGAEAWGHCYHLGGEDFGPNAGCTLHKGSHSDGEGWAFLYAFTNFGPSSFHLMPMGFEGNLGGFGWSEGGTPALIKINGRIVACNTQASEFLVTELGGNGAGTLSCES